MLMLQLYFPIKAPKLELFNVKSPQKKHLLGRYVASGKKAVKGAAPCKGGLAGLGKRMAGR